MDFFIRYSYFYLEGSSRKLNKNPFAQFLGFFWAPVDLRRDAPVAVGGRDRKSKDPMERIALIERVSEKLMDGRIELLR